LGRIPPSPQNFIQQWINRTRINIPERTHHLSLPENKLV
jgi:hypothetical protein